jgi:DNA-binding beta-propeller fold protein YncE
LQRLYAPPVVSRDSIAGGATGGRRLPTLALLVASALLLLFSATALALGELAQKAGTAGCVSLDGTGGACQTNAGLSGAYGIAASPDGKNVYVAAFNSSAVAILKRDTGSGALTPAGCVSQGGAGGCTSGNGLSGAVAVAVSADGKNVYVASGLGDSVAVFDRDPASGALAQKAGTAGCVSEDGSGGTCVDGMGLNNPQGVAVSPDGTSVYVASVDSNAVAILDRDTASGALTQKPGTAGCVSDTGVGGCLSGTALLGVHDVNVSPDAKNVYVAAANSSAVAIFDRNAGTGGLTEKAGTAGCVSETGTGGLCQDGQGLSSAWHVAPSPDGKSVYVTSNASSALAILDRDPASGALAQKAGTAGCVSDDGTGGNCQDGTAFAQASGSAVSPDGKFVYAASPTAGAVTILDRDTASGALTQKPGTAGCVSDDGTGGLCRDGTALDGASHVALSPDGKSVYVASDVSNAVAIFDRDPPAAVPTDKVAPRISGFSLSRKRFRVGKTRAPISARRRHRGSPSGSRFRFKLSERADVRIVIERALRGRKVGKLCKTPSRKLHKRRPCTRYKRSATLRRKNRAAGRNTISFSGRIGRRALKPGRYRATIRAMDPAGNRSKARRASFTIVRR